MCESTLQRFEEHVQSSFAHFVKRHTPVAVTQTCVNSTNPSSPLHNQFNWSWWFGFVVRVSTHAAVRIVPLENNRGALHRLFRRRSIDVNVPNIGWTGADLASAADHVTQGTRRGPQSDSSLRRVLQRDRSHPGAASSRVHLKGFSRW